MGGSSFGSYAANLGAQVASAGIGSIVSEGIGLAFNETNDTNQLAQQGALDQQQLQYQEAMGDYNYQQQLAMWNATNYPAQVQQMEKAGLNPGLMYAKGGQGGTTGIQPGVVNAPQAPYGAQSQIAQMNTQQMAIAADTNLKTAQANKIKAETPGAAGLQGAQTANLLQGVQNQQAQQQLTQMQTYAQQIQNDIQGQSADAQVAAIRNGAAKIDADAKTAVNSAWISQET